MVTRTATEGLWSGEALVARLVAADGSASHPHHARLCTGQAPLRDLGDLAHALCAVHGRHPGLVDAARDHAVQSGAAAWLEAAADGFAAERGYLAQLVAAAGPLPSTPGQALSEAALVNQRHTLAMLGGSDRTGCATGAAAALALDWIAVRRVLDLAADRFGIAAAPCRLPEPVDTRTLLAALASDRPVERALAFGGEQYLAQARGLWDLMEARAGARA